MNSPQFSENRDKIDHNRFTGRTRVAYFSMEIAIAPEMPTYSGGLGILAGDTARTASDLDLPIVFVTLISRAGYLRQELDAAGHQGDVPDPWDPQRWARPLPAMVAVPIGEQAARSGSAHGCTFCSARPAAPCRSSYWTLMSPRTIRMTAALPAGFTAAMQRCASSRKSSSVSAAKCCYGRSVSKSPPIPQ